MQEAYTYVWIYIAFVASAYVYHSTFPALLPYIYLRMNRICCEDGGSRGKGLGFGGSRREGGREEGGREAGRGGRDRGRVERDRFFC